MNMKKSLTVLMSAAIITGLTAGCGTSSDQGATNTSSATAAAKKEKVKLTYWTYQRHDADYIKSKIEAFNQANKDSIEVEMTMMAENYPQSVDLAFASDQAPDVFVPNGALDNYTKGYFEPLNKYLTDDMKKKFTINEGVNQFDGNIVSLPNVGSTVRLVYNVDMFEKAGLQPPKTLDEMVAAAKKITEIGKKDGIYGWALPYKNPSSSLTRSLQQMVELNGMHSSGFDFKTGKYDFTGWKPAVEALRQMKADGSTLPGAEALDMDPMRAQFAEGKIGMYMSYSVEPGVYKNQFPPKIKWDAVQIPTIGGGDPKGVINFNGGTWLSISSKSKHKAEAWKFIQYMYGDDIMRGYHENGFGLATNKHVLEGAKVPSIPGIQNFLPTKYDAAWPLPPRGVKPQGKTWAEDFNAYILVGGDLDQFIKGLNQRYNEAYDKGVKDGSIKAVQANPNFDPRSLQGK
ncbi:MULTISPECIES: ABC transporter substrate-binding protein [unclassified Paenibacillus]|uniref:ABC transporter substrate-binding protein n=1 Tax=unclassified Paenibacillus TaxID=185978 RepID=UPI00278B24D2|nr:MULTISPECIES: extracellular solute-binding protein [unclassified Paenibacillus]MDQ0899393.1 multiple sugar transport system substrate-binding protein [Paenibacillus sp. V4I7]MDQ0914570.1 multiple sugar transport system substrate-binding protein [Paenibacillus sp. V4I5]